MRKPFVHISIFVLIAICLVSCFGFWEARHIRNFVEEYTGLDTLIRIDGYYYHDDGRWIMSPILFSNNGRCFTAYSTLDNNHDRVQEWIKSSRFFNRGYYILYSDTIKVRWAMRFQPCSFFIFSRKFVIENDTTLRLIWQLRENCDTDDCRERDTIRNEIYRFFQYDFNTR